jgi:hypothetical protein
MTLRESGGMGGLPLDTIRKTEPKASQPPLWFLPSEKEGRSF